MRALKSALLISQALLLCALLTSCETKQDKNPAAQTDTLLDKKARQDSDALVESLPSLLNDLAISRAKGISLVSVLDPAKQDALPATSHTQLPILRTLYSKTENQYRWFEPAKKKAPALSSSGVAWVASLSELESTHGIFGEDLHLPAIQKHLSVLEQPVPRLDASLDAAQKQALVSWFEDNSQRFAQDQDNSRLLEALLEEGAPLSHLREPTAQLTAHYTDQQQSLAEGEVLLSAALVLYAERMRFNNKAWHRTKPVEKRELGPETNANSDEPDPSKEEPAEELTKEQLVTDALMPFFEEKKTIQELTMSLQPPYEQYGRLIQAYKRYQDIVEQGGWVALPESVIGLKRGSSSPAVVLLKERLRAEKMWDGDESEAFGPKLEKAVKHYQHTHQIWEKGFITKETWRSMNIPASRRLLRIRYSLERWRNIRVGSDSEYIYVNIPDFHAELWENEDLKLRFRVVTGSARKEWNQKDRKHERPRATKLFSDTMQYIVFNPYWNVPKGIVEEEILPKLEEEPEYLEENNYEWHELPSGNRVMRQTPGPHNALGLVKFLFPNDHNIYLHDTNQKGFFDYPIRAFSHGCIRVKEPMQLAEALLRRDGRWRDGMIEHYTKPGGGESWITLKKPLPVHIEYIVVRVDENGDPHFLADIYTMETLPMTRISSKSAAFTIAQSARSMVSTTTELAVND